MPLPAAARGWETPTKDVVTRPSPVTRTRHRAPDLGRQAQPELRASQDAPDLRAQGGAGEHLLVEKIFQKGGNGVSGIARWLQRHVRATDYTPRARFCAPISRRSVAELNIDVSPEDFAAVAECCAYDGDHAGEPGSLLGVRHIANRLVDLAAAGSGQASVFGQNESSPLTGTETERATLEARKAAVSDARAFNPDVEEPGRGHPHSPAAPAARSDPNSLLYDNPSGANVRAPPAPARGGVRPRRDPGEPGRQGSRRLPGQAPRAHRLRRRGARRRAPEALLTRRLRPRRMPALDTVQAVEDAAPRRAHGEDHEQVPGDANPERHARRRG